MDASENTSLKMSGSQYMTEQNRQRTVFATDPATGAELWNVRATAKQKDFMFDPTPLWQKLFVFSVALLLLYGFYAGWCIMWVELSVRHGDKILWLNFGMFISVFGVMLSGVMYSMSQQRTGWWTEDSFENVCFGPGCCPPKYLCWYPCGAN